MKKVFCKKSRAFTLVEMQIAVAIFSIIVVAVSSFIVYIYKSQKYNLAQLNAASTARRSLELISREVRNIRQAETGAFAIGTADSQSFIFYSDVDNDGQTEKIRYFLDNKQFKKGVTEPNYTGAETVSVIASDIVNDTDPVFKYYSQDFTGSQSPLSAPANVTLVKLVRIILKIDANENISPPALLIETNVQPRNLKEN